MNLQIVPVYAAVLALVFFVLAARTILLRVRHRVAVGDGDVAPLRRAMRAHANFAEYVPLCLLLFVFVEIAGAGAGTVHGLGLALLAGRCLHALALSREREPRFVRQVAMVLTFGPMLSAVGLVLQLHARG